MGQAKENRVTPIAKRDADALIIRLHYSHKKVNSAFLALCVFLGGRLEGAMTFGPPMDKSNIEGMIRDTAWNGFLELNRLAFSEAQQRKPRAGGRDADDQKALSAREKKASAVEYGLIAAGIALAIVALVNRLGGR
jgi:hypothetical protein